MTRVFARCVALAALVAAALPVVPSAAADRAVGWVISRRDGRPAPFEGEFRGGGTSEESMVWAMALAGPPGRRHVDYRFGSISMHWGVDGWAQPHVPGVVDPPPCAAACQTPVGLPTRVFLWSQNRPIASAVYVAAYDVVDATVTMTSPGWVVRPWRPTIRMLSAAAAGTGVAAAHSFVGSFHGAELPGGRWGSSVLANLPCEKDGWGEATLSGDGRDIPMDCHGFGFDDASRPVRWRVTGESFGRSDWSTVLIVVDFPR